MQLLKKEQEERAAGLRVASYVQIVQSLSKLPAEDKLRKKLDIAYFVAIKKLPFTKCPMQHL